MNEDILKQVTGKRLADAVKIIEDNDCIVRVTKRNGVPAVTTRDYITHRINLHVNDDFVKRAYFG